MVWNPTLYAAFAAPRLRPALDLLAQIGAEAPADIADLGCGPGNVTQILAERWPDARIAGLDSSPEMLAKAGEALPSLTWIRTDIATWAPERPLDVLYSNAALHWLDDHARLFPRLMENLAPGGWLAVQMPRNHAAPSHTAIAETIAASPWAERLTPLLRPPVPGPAFYYDLLAPLSAHLDIWESEYLHVLEGDNPVVRWTMGTTLSPLLSALDATERDAFLADYGRRIRTAYPPAGNGRTLFPFRRLFLIARRKS